MFHLQITFNSANKSRLLSLLLRYAIKIKNTTKILLCNYSLKTLLIFLLPLRPSPSLEQPDPADYEDHSLCFQRGHPSARSDPSVNPLPLGASGEEPPRREPGITPQTQPQGAESERRGELRVLVL